MTSLLAKRLLLELPKSVLLLLSDDLTDVVLALLLMMIDAECEFSFLFDGNALREREEVVGVVVDVIEAFVVVGIEEER